MRVRAQMAMVMNLDKCIGCSTCSVTCKQTWTNRDGVEYAWFNNVETKPGIGYPQRWEDQGRWKGGWTVDGSGRLRLRAGGRLRKLATIFANPDLPSLDDYYEPATYDFDTLLTAPAADRMPVARPLSAITGRPMAIEWGPNWDDDLGGSALYAATDPNLAGLTDQVQRSFETTFMFHLPRLCEHCLNPACVAACPSGALYKRERDGIVLVNQDKCRGWRMCVSACPYKKVYINRVTAKAEKCTFCFPRIEAGLPTVCAETCVGRLRYLGLVLYDLDRVEAAAAAPEAELVDAQRQVFLDPSDPAVIAQAAADGIPPDWLAAAQASPVYALALRHRVALPLHPEYRTLPMVWYIPPLSPVLDATTALGGDNTSADDVFHAVTELRIPLGYLASLFTAGDTGLVAGVLMKLAAVRAHMRAVTTGAGAPDDPAAAGATGPELEALYRLLAVAKMRDRYVVPPAHKEEAAELAAWASGCPLDRAPLAVA
ncbi:MAG: nitrate reductase subunit beta [Propionibacteriaceae bacterium]|jgi:nitrate reductase beta subunit|nr:nitrate reductase subunit beta [Propionibacteriaceae bacterium]